MVISTSQRFSILITSVLLLGLTGCGLFQPEDDPPVEQTTAGIYILCEGAFGAGNASLWRLSGDLDSTTAKVYQRLTEQPLGDTGQSLTVEGDRLYIVMNGSGTIEVLDLSGEAVIFVGSVDLPGASPRELAVLGGSGYVTAWGIPGVLVIDLATLAVTDTIHLAALPEDILAYDNHLYVALPLEPDYSLGHQVVEIDPGTRAVVDSFAVGSGPQQLLVRDGQLWVSRQWYDESFTAYRGIATVDLATGTVTSREWGPGAGSDIFLTGNTLYAAVTGGVVPVAADLSLEEPGFIAASLSTIYAAASDGTNIFIASYVDFSSPGEVVVYQPDGTKVKTVTVGIGPGSFGFVLD